MIGTPEQVMRAVELGVREICNVYGLSETYGNCTVDRRARSARGAAAVGRPAAARRDGAHLRHRIRRAAAGRRGRRDPRQGAAGQGVLQGSAEDRRGVRRARLLPHRRPRPARCRRAHVLQGPAQGDGQERRHQHRAGRSGGGADAPPRGAHRLRDRRAACHAGRGAGRHHRSRGRREPERRGAEGALRAARWPPTRCRTASTSRPSRNCR